MHLYENEERSVHTWNAVDVEIGGHLQHGYVIGLEETENTPARAIVDFGCSTQQAVPVPYGKIWDCSLYRSTKRCRGAAVEVLLHDGPDRPWTWCPAKMLISGFRDLDSAAMVEVITDGQRRRELLRRRQIRDLCSTAVRKGLLSADHFVMQTCRVPNGYWTLPSAESALLLREVERMFAVRLVTVLSQKMHFVRRRQNECLRDEDLAMMFEKRPTMFCLLRSVTQGNP
ncbi:uncharacterized protein LOC129602431 [Paramacrobiotus metropolitanus]|uniref:uncharacterized protein LOC129602431 n=1 Tax=Paramacrobiotus metropolitanus TaxID=2943436 RepID=UPI0024461694|nr:uncharacterized protein LOC129602431 [Paramacrobiotus metropolitanus]